MNLQDTNGNGTFIDEVVMCLLALISVIMVVVEINISLSERTLEIMAYIDTAIWIVFVVEYVYRLIKAEDKKEFIWTNKIDLLAIIPVDRMFKAFRFTKMFKLLRMFRGLTYIFRIVDIVKDVIKTNHFDYTLVVSSVTIFVGAILISIVEKMTFFDALWWSFVTATTVGYGDISPSTGIGRVIACILMLVGIGFIGMLTGTISTYFITIVDKNKGARSYKDTVIEGIKNQLDNLDSLSDDDIEHMFNIVKALKNT